MLKKITTYPLGLKAILFITAFIFYGNSLYNGYVLDDVLVITGNKYVKKGISGIYDILSHDSYFGASGKIAKASGGRYRPFSIVSFAIEKEFFGMKPFVFHFFNVFAYALLCILIFQFLFKHVFKDNFTAAFVCAFLFLIHPVHTEVVANIKSRDEIYSLLFLLLTLHLFLNYLKSGNIFASICSYISFFLALLSKEYGVVFLLVIPLTIYVFTQNKIKDILLRSIPYWIILFGYMLIRFSVNKLSIVEETDVLNSPYLLASVQEKFATIAWVLLQYIKLFLYPQPLSYDYSYNQISYVTFSNLQTILSLFLYAVLTVSAIVLTFRKNKAGYFILLYLFSVFIVSNVLINVATPMADRFLFGPGLFLLIGVVLLLLPLLKTAKRISNAMVFTSMLLLAIPAFSAVYNRNKDWNNNDSLYFKDVQTSSNSVRALAFCGMNLVNENELYSDSLTKRNNLMQAITYFEKAYKIYPSFGTMFQNWGLAYYKLEKMDSAAWAWNRYDVLRPGNKFSAMNKEALAKYYYEYYHKKYILALNENKKEEMLSTYRMAVKSYDKMPESWVLLGQLYLLNGQKDSAIISWNKCLSMEPGNQNAINFLKELKR